MAWTEDTALIRQAMAYVIELYRELTEENGAPTLGTQNQVVDWILGDPELRRAIADWARSVGTGEATTAPPQRLPRDTAYDRVRVHLLSVMERPIFTRPGQHSGDRR